MGNDSGKDPTVRWKKAEQAAEQGGQRLARQGLLDHRGDFDLGSRKSGNLLNGFDWHYNQLHCRREKRWT